MNGQPPPASPLRRFAIAVLIGVGCFIGAMSLPILFSVAGDVGGMIGVGLFLGLAAWAVGHAFNHDAQRRQAAQHESQTANPIEILRHILTDERQSWVLFRHGTFVVVTEPQAGLAEQAVALLRRHGPVIAGCESGDFGAHQLIKFAGWIVTSHREDMMTYVGSDEMAGSPETVLSVGLFGRGKRGLDAAELEVIHVEDKRQGPGMAARFMSLSPVR